MQMVGISENEFMILRFTQQDFSVLKSFFVACQALIKLMKGGTMFPSSHSLCALFHRICYRCLVTNIADCTVRLSPHVTNFFGELLTFVKLILAVVSNHDICPSPANNTNTKLQPPNCSHPIHAPTNPILHSTHRHPKTNPPTKT